MARNSGRGYGKARASVASVARERIEILFALAKEVSTVDARMSRRYVDLAKRISERTKVKVPSEFKKYVCKGCGIALVPGRNAKVRLHARGSGIIISCSTCGAVRRFPVSAGKSSGVDGHSMKPYIAQVVPSPKKNSR